MIFFNINLTKVTFYTLELKKNVIYQKCDGLKSQYFLRINLKIFSTILFLHYELYLFKIKHRMI